MKNVLMGMLIVLMVTSAASYANVYKNVVMGTPTTAGVNNQEDKTVSPRDLMINADATNVGGVYQSIDLDGDTIDDTFGFLGGIGFYEQKGYHSTKSYDRDVVPNAGVHTVSHRY